ncbi:M24 family metallopeptidase [Enterococcus saccharolyticus]|uniref:M24 family metallopeptidase n=1 Tax=Enterococcus saccharolyticus TaxID=41997 RepID=UPI001E504BE8|nr:aminopeptidase P family protein [Enterococcus saccharolyticus]MCD5002380.1 M24 family metallopeptidase [Enterococcus saccharolyticus]
MNVHLEKIVPPEKDNSGKIVQLTDKTLEERRKKILDAMNRENLDTLIIYNDLEHAGNFSYLTGFVTRFEEGLLVLHRTGKAYLILGNENTKMVNYSRIPARLIHTPFFSLPDQPMEGEVPLTEVFKKAEVTVKSNVGLVGWKMFTGQTVNNRQLFDLPNYIVSAIQAVVTEGKIENWTDLFIHAEYGARAINNANEIAHYEFGSSLASDCVLDALAEVAVGKTELEIADKLVRYGQLPNIVPIAATGERFENAYIFPRNKAITLGDKMSITTGFKGGLASRSGYAVTSAAELPEGQQDYLEKVAEPYFRAVVTWLENIEIGKKGKEIYQVIDEVLPKNNYHWELNPGHLTSDEEWMSSPIKVDSEIKIQSGMLFQIDIIPSVPGYAGASCESGVAFADSTLRQQIQQEYPELWSRITKRQNYIRSVLNINLPESVLPLSSGVAYYAPFFLQLDCAMVKG